MSSCLNELGDLLEYLQVNLFGTAKRKALEERKNPLRESYGSGDFKIEDTIPASSNRSDPEGFGQEHWKLRSDLRNVER